MLMITFINRIIEVSLKVVFDLLLAELPSLSGKMDSKNAIVKLLEQDSIIELQNLVYLDDRYKVDASAGAGIIADIPWISIFDRTITESAQNGYYIVFLFSSDASGVYLSLNQGVNSVKEQYAGATKNILLEKGLDLKARAEPLPNNLVIGEIDLKAKTPTGRLYQYGSVFSLYYEANNIPNDIHIKNDIETFLKLYDRIVISNDTAYAAIELDVIEELLSKEDRTRYRIHKRIERNQSLIKKVKKQKGFKCEACGFSFDEKYTIGSDYIEAHHLTPFNRLKNQIVDLNISTDFAVLCANCHRMIHAAGAPSLEEFKKLIK